MIRLTFLFSYIVVSCFAYSQGRDTLVTRQLYFLETDYNKAVLDTQTCWSDKLVNYIDYSRIEMGRRMNASIKYNKRANHQFAFGMTSIGVGSCFYVLAAYSDPVVYVESHSDYSRRYYNDARNRRDAFIITGSLFTAFGAYFVWRSYHNNRKARWAIYPDGLKYHF